MNGLFTRGILRPSWALVAIVGALSVGALSVGACGGSATPAKAPENPPLVDGDPGGEGSAGGVAAASSAKVKEGMDAIQAGDYARAKTVLAEAQTAAPKDAQAAFYLGVAEENLKEIDQAKVQYKRAIELDPALVEASVNLSAMLLDTDDGRGALEVVEAALKKAPEDPALLTNRALALQASGDSQKALDAFAKALAKNPNAVEVRYEYAVALATAGKNDEAVNQLDSVVAGKDIALVLAGGVMLSQLHAWDKCVAALDRAIKEQPAPEGYVRRGQCKGGKKDLAGAQADYEAALKLDPKQAGAHFWLGKLFEEQKKKKEAQASFEKAVQFGQGTPVEKAAKKALEELKAGK